MKRLLIVPFLLLGSPAFAQGAHSAANQNACSRDASRFCRAKMSDGDMVMLGCLKEHRAKLGKACAKVLTENGQ